MTDGAGVPPLAGVPGLESVPFSGFEAAGAGTGVELEVGESLMSFTGVSSLTGCESGSMIARSLSGETLSVTVLIDAVVVLVVVAVVVVVAADDLRRSLAGVADLLEGAIVLIVMIFRTEFADTIW